MGHQILRVRNDLRLPRGNFLDFNGVGSVILMHVFCELVRRLFDIVSVVILYRRIDPGFPSNGSTRAEWGLMENISCHTSL